MKNILGLMRQNKNMTLEEVATEIGVHQSSISCYENGMTMPSDEITEKLANYYHIDLKELKKALKKSYKKNKKTNSSNKVSKKNYKNQLFDLRLAKNWTQNEAAEKVGLTGATLSTYENRRYYPVSSEIERKIENLYGIPSFKKAYNTRSEAYYAVSKKPTVTPKPAEHKTVNAVPAEKTTSVRKSMPSVDGLLERVYGKVSMEDFKTIEELINLSKNV